MVNVGKYTSPMDPMGYDFLLKKTWELETCIGGIGLPKNLGKIFPSRSYHTSDGQLQVVVVQWFGLVFFGGTITFYWLFQLDDEPNLSIKNGCLGGAFKYFFIFTPIWGRFPI